MASVCVGSLEQRALNFGDGHLQEMSSMKPNRLGVSPRRGSGPRDAALRGSTATSRLWDPCAGRLCAALNIGFKGTSRDRRGRRHLVVVVTPCSLPSSVVLAVLAALAALVALAVVFLPWRRVSRAPCCGLSRGWVG